jgi:hypothetical protein
VPNHPTDRFDDLPPSSGRVGAHRAEQPRVRRRTLMLWAVIAIVVLVAAGVVGTLWAGGRLGGAPGSSSAPTIGPTADPVLDTTYTVVVLNATPQEGLSGAVGEEVVAAGWSEDDVTAGDAGSHDFERTTVFYARAEDEGPARGLAEAIGGADVELSEAYQDGDDETLRQLVVVVGLDRATVEESTPAG